MKTWIEVSGQALRSNYQTIKAAVSPAQVLAVVKSDAYGHGLEQVAEVLKDFTDGFAVDRAEEGMKLRALGITQSIVILGYTEPSLLKQAIQARLELTVADLEQLEQLHFTTQEERSPVSIHLEVETGLYRQGIPEDQLVRIAELLRRMPWVTVKGLYTHFANVEEDEDGTYPKEQLARFAQSQSALAEAGIHPTLRHTACSAAALGLPASRFEAVRVGIALYGLWSSELTEKQAGALGIASGALQPVLTWKTVITQTKLVAAGETIGYARSARVTRETRIAVLPIGYYDGYSRSLSSRGAVVIQDVLCPIIGRICMNMCMVDVTDVPGALPVGTEVVLIGQGMPAVEVCRRAETIHHELFARLSSTIPRRLVD